jgi:hypothetical protein
MKKVIYAIAFISAFSAIFSCQKEDYNVSDLQTEQKLISQTKPLDSDNTTSSPNSLLSSSVVCDWEISLVGTNVGTCAQAVNCLQDEFGNIIGPCFSPPPATTKVTINVLGTPSGTPPPPPIVIFVPEGGVPVTPQIGNNPPGEIKVSAVSGNITFEGTVKVDIKVLTPASPIDPTDPTKRIPTLCTFKPNQSKKGCKNGIFTTLTVPFGIGGDCSVSFPQ